MLIIIRFMIVDSQGKWIINIWKINNNNQFTAMTYVGESV